MPTISVLEFAALLAGYNGSSHSLYFGASTTTEPDTLKKDRNTKALPHWTGKLYCDSVGLFRLGGSYQNMVNNRREKEGMEKDFQAEENWFRRIGDSPLVVGKSGAKAGKFYLFLIREKTISSLYYDSAGNTYDRESLAGFLPIKKPSEKQGTEDQVKVNTYHLESFRSFRFGGQEYTIDHKTAAAALSA